MSASDLASAFAFCAQHVHHPPLRPHAVVSSQQRREIVALSVQLKDVRSYRDRLPVLVYLYVLAAVELLRRADLAAAPEMSLADLQWLAELRRELDEDLLLARRACGEDAGEVERIHALSSWRPLLTVENTRRAQPASVSTAAHPHENRLKLAAVLLIAAVIGLFVHLGVFIAFSIAAVVLYAYVMLLPRPFVAPAPPPADLPAALRSLSDADSVALEREIDAAVEDARMRWSVPDAPPELSVDELLE